jgi:peptidoglycan/LPS O-acetylase OafA/YrhL
MIVGAIGAMLYSQNYQLLIKIIVNPFSQVFAWACLLLVAINRFHIASFLDNEFLSIITVVLILGQVEQKGLLSLENRVFDFFGKISYGIYVIHPLLIFLCSKYYLNFSKENWLNYMSVYTLVFGCTILISYLSYKYFETPFLKLKEKKFTVIKSAAFSNSK